jgi:hypothetical protein
MLCLLEMYTDEWSSIISKRVKLYCNSQLRNNNIGVPSLPVAQVPKSMDGVIELSELYGSFLKVGNGRERGVPTDSHGVITSISESVLPYTDLIDVLSI